MAPPWPAELRLHKDRQALTVTFDDGESFALAAEYLRVRSPSAEVQGHSPSERRTVAGKQDVRILELHPVGNYAVRLVFDDLHSTGIFSWDYLTSSAAIASHTGAIISPSWPRRICHARRRGERGAVGPDPSDHYLGTARCPKSARATISPA